MLGRAGEGHWLRIGQSERGLLKVPAGLGPSWVAVTVTSDEEVEVAVFQGIDALWEEKTGRGRPTEERGSAKGTSFSMHAWCSKAPALIAIENLSGLGTNVVVQVARADEFLDQVEAVVSE